jgi:SAM-dependent methyltransferase
MNKKTMWDERYSAKEYAYGIEPNDFLKANVNALLKGSILSLAEGEGRNAVFLAKQGYDVTAVDSSLVGIDKGRKLAQKNKVDINFIHADLADYDFGENQWDGIISIFCPLPSILRKNIHGKIVKALKQNGTYILEAYTAEQLNNSTGGGKTLDTMQSSTSLSDELTGLRFDHLVEIKRHVIEGTYHTGMAAVVQAIAKK